MTTTYWIAYNNLKNLKNDLNSLTELNPKYVLRKKIIRNIDLADSYIEKYSLNKKETWLTQYDSCINEAGKDMDQLNLIATENPMYFEELASFGFLIKAKLTLGEHKIKLAESYDSKVNFSKIIEQLNDYPESKTIVPADEKKPEGGKKGKFFSRLFSKNKTKSEETRTLNEETQGNITTAEIKQLLAKVEKKENKHTNAYLRQILTLIDKDNKIQDSLFKVSTRMEKLEAAESIIVINKLTDNTTNKTTDILTALVFSGILIMIIFVVLVYRQTNYNNRLRRELIEEKKSSEKLAKAKEEFLATMSHEIRTPLNVIMGFSEQLQKTHLTDSQHKLLLNIKRSSSHLHTIIDEILDYTKMESGGLLLEHIIFKIRDVIDDVYVSFKSIAEKNGLKFSYTIHDSVAKNLIGDPIRLKQILLNLTGNAVKFTKEGGIEIHCKVEESDEKRQILLFQVKDTGIGIAPDYQEHIFDQFTQADSSVTRKYGGTGLGLAISKKLVEVQHGEIGVQSELNKGSIFHFTIPYLIAAEYTDQANIPHERKITDDGSLKNKKILIADDDEMNKLLAQHILEGLGIIVDTAENGKEALDKIIKNEYDVILMDLHMPHMGGLEVTREVRKRLISTPIIAVTGNVVKGEKEKCLRAGMDNFIAKPYYEKELIRQISNVIPTIA